MITGFARALTGSPPARSQLEQCNPVHHMVRLTSGPMPGLCAASAVELKQALLHVGTGRDSTTSQAWIAFTIIQILWRVSPAHAQHPSTRAHGMPYTDTAVDQPEQVHAALPSHCIMHAPTGPNETQYSNTQVSLDCMCQFIFGGSTLPTYQDSACHGSPSALDKVAMQFQHGMDCHAKHRR